MTFMLNYTNPVLESVSDAFAISGAHAEPTMDSTTKSEPPAGFFHDEYMAGLFSGIFSGLETDQEMELIDQAVTALPMSSPTSMQHRADEMILLLTAQHDLTQDTNGHFPIAMARSVFTSTNLVEFVSSFFHFFHPHTPFIHRPMFDMDNVSIHLLLAVFLVGSIFCTPQDDALATRCFFGLAEEYVFQLLREVIVRPSSSCDVNIQVVQAAVLIHALQVNSNHEGVRLRVRVNRFPEIVAAMRHLDLFGVAHTRNLKLGAWEQFIVDETKIR
jgi:hypothetical protein